MKKNNWVIFLFILCSVFLYSQVNDDIIVDENATDTDSIFESEDYKLARKYRELALEAHNNGDYNESIELSKASQAYSANIIAKYGFYTYVLASKRDAENSLRLFKEVGGDTNTITSDLFLVSYTELTNANKMFELSTNDNDYSNTMIQYHSSDEKSKLGYNILNSDFRINALKEENILTDDNSSNIYSKRDSVLSNLSNTNYITASSEARDLVALLDEIEAPYLYSKAESALQDSKDNGYDTQKPNLFNEASNYLSLSKENLASKDYSNSLINSRSVIDLANLMKTSPSDVTDNNSTDETTLVDNNNNNNSDDISTDMIFPKYYKVIQNDSLWRIATYDYIYGNGYRWRLIYNANKDKIKDPNVIRAGMILTIPSIKNETRDGTYDPNKKYNSIKNVQ